MANNNVYEININLNGASAGESDTGNTTADGATAGGDGGVSFGKNVTKAYIAKKILDPVAKATIQYYTERVGMFSGSQNLQDKVDYAKRIVGEVGSIVGSTVAGAVAFGPAGAVVGAVAGAIGVGIGYAVQRADYEWNAGIDAVNVRYAQQRQGYSFNRSRQNA